MECRVPPRNAPRSFFYKCNLQGAIDFAELRKRSGGAERKAELEHRSNLRSGTAELSAELEAWSGMPRVLRRGRLCT